MLILIQLGLSSLLNTQHTFTITMDANMTKFISYCCIMKVLISTITMNTITKPYHIAVCTVTLHQHLSEVTMFKINKRHSFSINFVILLIHQVYNNKDLSATIVMMTT
jgi:hypothetical protein